MGERLGRSPIASPYHTQYVLCFSCIVLFFERHVHNNRCQGLVSYRGGWSVNVFDEHVLMESGVSYH